MGNIEQVLSNYVGNAYVAVVANELAGLTDFHGPVSPVTLWGDHYRSDGIEGIFLGEEIGIVILKDWREANPKLTVLTLKKFNRKLNIAIIKSRI